MVRFGSSNHKYFKVRYCFIGSLFRFIDKPGISFIVLHLERLTENYLFKAFGYGRNSFLKL